MSNQTMEFVISPRRFNDIYLPYLNNDSRYLIFYGGAGSGKSYFIASRYVIKLLECAKFNLLVVRAYAKDNRTSTFNLLKQIINQWGLSAYFKITESIMRIVCTLNGNEVVFAGLDDVEKLKSITFERGELTDIWIEEASQIEEPDFKQLDVRLRGGKSKKQIVLSFNPIDVNHWLKKRFIDEVPDNCTFLKTTYRHNRFLEDDYIALLESFKETDLYYYQVYCLGEWGVYGYTVFAAAKVAERMTAGIKPVKTGLFLYGEDNNGLFDISFETKHPSPAGDTLFTKEGKNRNDGYVRIYKEPERGRPYVIGGDTAGEGADWFAGQVIDNITGEQVAVLRHKFDEDLYARQMYCLGKYYNTALIAIEKNFSMYPIKELQRLGYTKQYVTEHMDTYTGRLAESYGFRTDVNSRQTIISGLIKAFRERPENVGDYGTLSEMQTFVRNEKGRPEAMAGAHDDLVMALAIAHAVRGQQTGEETVFVQPNVRQVKWRDSQWEDYYNADIDEQKEFIRKWGNPF